MQVSGGVATWGRSIVWVAQGCSPLLYYVWALTVLECGCHCQVTVIRLSFDDQAEGLDSLAMQPRPRLSIAEGLLTAHPDFDPLVQTSNAIAASGLDFPATFVCCEPPY